MPPPLDREPPPYDRPPPYELPPDFDLPDDERPKMPPNMPPELELFGLLELDELDVLDGFTPEEDEL